MKKLSTLMAISPIDGRYYKQNCALRNIFSEFGLLKFRIIVEIRWLQTLANSNEINEILPFSDIENNFLEKLISNFNLKDAFAIKKIEKNVNHDLKAIEYFLKEKIKIIPNLKKITEFIHFSCTSEDINNLAYALILIHARNKILLPTWKKIINKIQDLGINYKNIAILSRTHGKPATPSTLGKEMINITYRLYRQFHQLKKIKILGKMNGTVGNYNAHIAAYPKINWRKFNEKFVISLGITWNPYTTQIEPHDYIAEISDCIARFNTILINFNRDIWGYIALDYFEQKKPISEIGSSVMPYKINPINFENSEGNLGLSNAMLNHFSSKLPISRWQRDLSDSTVLRSLGTGIGYSIIAYNNTLKGIKTIKVNKKHISNELKNNWLTLSEAIQTTMRKHNIVNSYELTKEYLLQHNYIDHTKIKKFIDSLPLPIEEKNRLKKITPTNYIGLAKELVEDFANQILI